MVSTAWRWGMGASHSSRSHSAHSSCFFFSQEGQKLRPRQEKATSTLRRHPEHHNRAKRGPWCRAKRVGQTRSSSSNCCSTSRKRGDSRGRLGL